MRAAWLLAGVNALIVAALLLAYHLLVARPAQRIGVVDLGEVYRLKEAEFTRVLTQSGGDDDDRNRAMASVRQFSQRLPIALEELPRDCGCLVILKTALAGTTPNTIDLTASLKTKVDAK